MNSKAFKEKLFINRNNLLESILERFSLLGATSIYQFGSIAKGSADEFSDLDLWITFNKNQLKKIINNRVHIFSSIGKVLIIHETPKNSPLGGKYSLIIYEIDNELYQVDVYISPVSTAHIPSEGKLIFGKNLLTPGNWVLDEDAESNENQSERINFLLCMAFIGIKKCVRNDTNFINFLNSSYYAIREKFFQELGTISFNDGFKAIEQILKELVCVANPSQKYAAIKILSFLKKAQELHQLDCVTQ